MQLFMKRIKHHDQGGFIPGTQGWVNIKKSINIIHYVNIIKNKNNMIISIETDKTLHEIQHLSKNLGIEE